MSSANLTFKGAHVEVTGTKNEIAGVKRALESLVPLRDAIEAARDEFDVMADQLRGSERDVDALVVRCTNAYEKTQAALDLVDGTS